MPFARAMTKGRWQPRALAVIMALVWQVLILAALDLGARPGAPLVWQPDAHSAISLPKESIIEDVAITTSANSVSRTARDLNASATVNDSTDRALKHAIARADRALAKDAGVAVAVPPLPAVTGDLPIRCEVHIHQDGRGQVQAIDFGVCTGDEAWQRDLLDRLEQAARLLRPSEGASVAPVTTLVFDTDSISPEILASQLMEPRALPTESHDASARVTR